MSQGARFGKAAVMSAKSGSSCTESCLYFMFTAIMIAVFLIMFELVIPGYEIEFFGKTLYISTDFYNANKFWFNTFASMLGMAISLMVISWHKHTVKKRIAQYSRGF
jgi:hypothetical protein